MVCLLCATGVKTTVCLPQISVKPMAIQRKCEIRRTRILHFVRNVYNCPLATSFCFNGKFVDEPRPARNTCKNQRRSNCAQIENKTTKGNNKGERRTLAHRQERNRHRLVTTRLPLGHHRVSGEGGDDPDLDRRS